METHSLKVVTDSQMLSNIRTLLDNTSHPLHNVLAHQSIRLRLPKCTTEPHRKSTQRMAVTISLQFPYLTGYTGSAHPLREHNCQCDNKGTSISDLFYISVLCNISAYLYIRAIYINKGIL